MTTPAESETTTVDPGFPRGGCRDSPDPYYLNAYDSVLGHDGLPVRDEKNERSVYIVFAAMCTYAPTLILLNLYCIWLIYRQEQLTTNVKFILILDPGCRLFEALATLYKAPCLLNYWCVEVYAPFLSNAIITSSQIGMTYSTQLLGNALSFYRFFAIFFDGRLYRYAEKIAVPHALLAWGLPVALFCSGIGNLYNPLDDFTCYGGLHWDPQNYTNMIVYLWNWSLFGLLANIDYVMYGVLVVSLTLDLCTFFMLRRFVRKNVDRKRADRKLAVMLIVTHVITAFFFLGKYLGSKLGMIGYTPASQFIMNEGVPVVGPGVYALVVALFNRTPREETEKPKIISVGESAKDSICRV